MRLATVVAVLGVAACGPSPLPSQPTIATPTSPTSPTPVSFAISANQTVVTVGTPTQLHALGTYSDGSTVNVDNATSWSVPAGAGCSVSSTGLVSCATAAQVTVRASWSGLAATVDITARNIVVPPQEFVIAAQVNEAEPTSDVELGGVRVEIAGGPRAGAVAYTDPAGRVTLPAVSAGGFAVYFTRPGYDNVKYDVVQLPRDASPSIVMMPSAGDVSSTFASADACALPGYSYSTNPNGPGATVFGWGLAKFPVYHSGSLRVTESSGPSGTPPLNVFKISSDGRLLSGGEPLHSGASIPVEGGFNYALALNLGDYNYYVWCNRPYRVSITRPK